MMDKRYGHITHDLRDAKISHTLGLYIPGLLFTSRYTSSLTNLWGAKSVLVFFTRYPNTSEFKINRRETKLFTRQKNDYHLTGTTL